MSTFSYLRSNATLVDLRWGCRLDLPRVVEIAASSFESPWDHRDFMTALKRRDCVLMVAEVGDVIVGYMVYVLHRDRIEIVTLGVAPEYRGRGIGRQLVEKAGDKAYYLSGKRVASTVRESLTGGLMFLRACGFRAVEVLRGEFWDTDEAGVAMVMKV
ncbi:putative acetyltransferase [Gemmata sp. SH-PL17]|uniref:GNAT family N-acetyltransferase n=1 Tax=Gemmata sp. SH-PL17 TaxID=1630693 RepID=UPI00078CCC25|nr:GNAT family N-acetyltransferase [Gemmata sp. SH-PL17]AMV24618.1 putative acetyltransferase [Gemmata sp. SH-PL17]